MPLRIAAVMAILIAAFAPTRAVARPGDLDPTFGDEGRATVPFALVDDLALDPQNRILVAGKTFELVGGPPAVAPSGFPPTTISHTFVGRWDQNGVLDPTFGVGGIVEIGAIGSGRLATQPDGKVLVGTISVFISGETSIHAALSIARLDTAGRRDPSFGDGGELVVPHADGRGFGTPELLVEPDGRITAAALECDPTCGILAVVHSDAEGALPGVSRTPGGLDGIQESTLVFGKDGSIVLGGRTFETDFPLSLVRYTPLGAFDGRTDTSLPLTRFGNPILTIDDEDRTLAVGIREPGFEVRRFLPNGMPDTHFTSTMIAPPGSVAPAAIALQPDGRIVVAGTAGLPSGESRVLLALLGANGGFDESLGTNGIVLSPAETVDGAAALAIQPDGRFVVLASEGQTLVLARFEGTARECGDADGDADLSVTDGVRVLRAAADLPSSCLASFCDVDRNGAISVSDGVRVLRAAAELPTQLRCAP